MSAKKKPSGIPAETVELYEKLVSTVPDLERKGAENPYTSLNGNMFSLLQPPGTLALRLPEEEREKFLKKYKTKLHETYGAVMKEYVTVPDSLLKNTKELAKYFRVSYEYVVTLRAKPTKKK
jgi:TfoX/Sxy family transcriptional regulator of competence genes